MKLEQPMRGLGPRVMISFPAQQSDKASHLAEQLRAKGCWVTLESNGDGRLKDLDARLDDTEVFVQLRTKDCGAAVAQLDGMLKQALARQERDVRFVLVPVALDGSASGGPFGDLVYIDASLRGLGWLSTLDLIARTALSAVHALPLSTTTALEFDSESMKLVLDYAPRDRRRIICDSGDTILASARRIVERAQTLDRPTHDAISRQTDTFVHSVEDQLLALDTVLRKLVAELHAQHSGYSLYDLEYGHRAGRSIDRFSRLALWRTVKGLAEWSTYLDKQQRELFSGSATEVLEYIAAHSPRDEMHGLAAWALGAHRVDRCDEFIEVEAAAPRRTTMRWYLPQSIFGKDWQVILQFGARPSGEITTGDWLDFVMPQIAFRAWGAVAPRIPDLAERLDREFAWRIDDYNSMVMA